MDQTLQTKFREKIYENYLEEAFACFSNFDLCGEKNASYMKQESDYAAKLKMTEKEIADAILLPPDQCYDKQKALKVDMKKYKEALESIRTAGKKAYDEAAKWQERAIAYLEKAEHVKKFKLNTLEEIEENKKKRAETEAAGTTVDTKVETAVNDSK